MAQRTKAIILLSQYPKSVANDIIYKLELDKLLDYVLVTPDRFNPIPFQDKDAEMLAVFHGSRNHFEQILARNKDIQWIHTLISGIDRIKGRSLLEFKGKTTNSRGSESKGLAEFVGFGMLWHSKRGEKWIDLKAKRTWDPVPVEMLAEKTQGIVGYGAIGQEVAKCIKYGYRSKVVACDVTDPEKLSPSAKDAIDHLYNLDELDKVLEESDYVVNLVPLNPQTKNMWDMEKFRKMKDSAIFMNLGRGQSVDEEDLAFALHNETIAGACLDVFSSEPLTEENPQWEAPNLLMTPHCGGVSLHGLERSFEILKENVLRYRESGQDNLKNVVDVRLGY